MARARVPACGLRAFRFLRRHVCTCVRVLTSSFSSMSLSAGVSCPPSCAIGGVALGSLGEGPAAAVAAERRQLSGGGGRKGGHGVSEILFGCARA